MQIVTTRDAISETGKSSYIAMVTGFWYEYTMAMPQSFGIDFKTRHASFFDDGETKVSVSTMAQVGIRLPVLMKVG